MKIITEILDHEFNFQTSNFSSEFYGANGFNYLIKKMVSIIIFNYLCFRHNANHCTYVDDINDIKILKYQ